MDEYSDYNHLKLKHEMCVSYNTQLKEYSYDATLTEVPYNMLDWLKEHIGKDNFIFGFEDYGQHGEWMLYTRSREDLLAFKLRWCIHVF